MTFVPGPLPPNIELETPAVLRKLISAHRYLAELKGVAATIPNETILINTLTLQEAKDSSAIENIITTHDELFKADLFADLFKSAAAKEVQNYANALKKGFNLVRSRKILTINHILEIQQELELNQAGFRRVPGTTLKNQQSGHVVYVPPQDYDTIYRLMSNLEQYINDDSLSFVDPLVKMAVVHFQFESIHPFYDGNGRTGRILNILYLVIKDLLNLPILYLSRYIIQNKRDYYHLIQDVRDNNNWSGWVLFILESVIQTSRQTIIQIGEIQKLMQRYKHDIRQQLPRIYSQDILNNLFRHPYTKIDFIMRDLGVSRLTATRYLDQLTEKGFVIKKKIGTSNYYINMPLMELFVSREDVNVQ